MSITVVIAAVRHCVDQRGVDAMTMAFIGNPLTGAGLAHVGFTSGSCSSAALFLLLLRL